VGKRAYLLLLLLPISLLLAKPRTKGFSLDKITGSHRYDSRYDHPPHCDLTPILSQNYHYLGSGKECYAFSSEDEKYVIKFFKQKHISLKPWQKALPFLFKEKVRRRLALRESTFQSYLIAFEIIPHLTHVIYLHLNQTDHLNPKLTLTDQNNTPFTLNLNEMEFLIQRRAQPLLMALKDRPERSYIDSIVELIRQRRALNIIDDDLNCERNLGILNGKAMSIDIGEFRMGIPPLTLKEEVQAATIDLKSYLSEHNSEQNQSLISLIDSL